jgi:hypothetical protein
MVMSERQWIKRAFRLVLADAKQAHRLALVTHDPNKRRHLQWLRSRCIEDARQLKDMMQ